ncbi:polyprenyl synthetase family protein [Kocuria sp. p3-SID1433]|nr:MULTISPECIES: polyprenyl synthetase family protein [unclassified Kocuria]MCT1602332.1 polyprenyl synthetase family protein [Kocuria sp. p3-SID1428]MCT2180513.1 polyprenyl synthetase family protein [Kocuria sp. p3-SID1433]
MSSILPPSFAAVAGDEVLGPQLLEGLAAIEARLAQCVQSTDPLIQVTSTHLLRAGGKRVRPLLTLLSAQVGGGINDHVIDAAVVVELTHLASLYHDDVMDSAPVRRGVETAHTVWGNSVAILTGDLIFARASSLVAELPGDSFRVQANAFARLVEGQLKETSGVPEGADALEHYLQVLAGKTGSLIAACGIYGAGLSGAEPGVREAMEAYGERIGVAFQLADDIIDITSPSEVTGKTTGTDLREGVLTLPVLMLRRMAAAGDRSAQRALELVDADLTSDDALAAAVEAICSHEAVERSWAVAQEWVDDALRALEPLPETAAKTALEAFGRDMVHRRS